jgi:hypothetical protein
MQAIHFIANTLYANKVPTTHVYSPGLGVWMHGKIQTNGRKALKLMEELSKYSTRQRYWSRGVVYFAKLENFVNEPIIMHSSINFFFRNLGRVELRLGLVR